MTSVLLRRKVAESWASKSINMILKWWLFDNHVAGPFIFAADGCAEVPLAFDDHVSPRPRNFSLPRYSLWLSKYPAWQIINMRLFESCMSFAISTRIRAGHTAERKQHFVYTNSPTFPNFPIHPNEIQTNVHCSFNCQDCCRISSRPFDGCQNYIFIHLCIFDLFIVSIIHSGNLVLPNWTISLFGF